jgi:hypothetical protein
LAPAGVGRLISRSRSKSVVTLTIVVGAAVARRRIAAQEHIRQQGRPEGRIARRGPVSPTHVVFAPNKTRWGQRGLADQRATGSGGFGGSGDAARTRCRPVSRAEGSRGSLGTPHSRLHGTHDLRADAHQCKVSLEPSAAAVIIAGIPIARVATAIARASIMAIPLDSASSISLIGSLRNRFADRISTARRLQAYFTAKGFGFTTCGNNRASVSQFVAEIGHASHPTMLRGDVAVRRRAGHTSGSVGLSTPLHLFRCSDSPAQHGQRGRERARQSRLPARG